MSILDKIIDGQIKKFNALRKVFFPADTRCFVLKYEGVTIGYISLKELTTGWNLKYSEFRGYFRLSFATHDQAFRNIIGVATHVAVDGDIYEIEQGENVPPKGTKPYWKIAARYIGGKKYIPQV